MLIAAAIPFFGTGGLRKPINQTTAYRLLTHEGKGRGVFPLIPYGPNENGLTEQARPPTWFSTWFLKDKNSSTYHILGTDESGRDVLVRLIHGARVSLAVGFVATGIAAVLGILFGAWAGYAGGKVDLLFSRVIEIMMCIPTFFLILTVIAVIDQRSILNIMLIIGFTSWTGYARLMRGEVFKQKQLDYATGAIALGASPWRAVFRHILPNAMSPVFVSISFGIASAILTESSLSFLGIGVQPPTPTWGELLNQAKSLPTHLWWLVVFPGVCIFLGVFSYNLVGDGIRDALDPRLSK